MKDKEIPRGFIIDEKCQFNPESIIKSNVIEVKYKSEPIKSNGGYPPDNTNWVLSDPLHGCTKEMLESLLPKTEELKSNELTIYGTKGEL